jgi:hypothetical protein
MFKKLFKKDRKALTINRLNEMIIFINVKKNITLNKDEITLLAKMILISPVKNCNTLLMNEFFEMKKELPLTICL